MAKATREITKPRKRVAGTGEPVLVRLQPVLAQKLDNWRRDEDDLPSRPEAVRRLIELGLSAPKPKAKR